LTNCGHRPTFAESFEKGRNVSPRAILLALVPFFSTAQANELTAQQCSKIREDTRRLHCYDEITPPVVTKNNDEYEKMTVNDVYLDWRQLLEHKVSVRGIFQDLSAFFMIRDVEGGGVVEVDVSRAPRSDRATVAGCNINCVVTVRGIVMDNQGSNVVTDMSIAPRIYAEFISKE
jgi:hypothetical protein